MVVVVLGWFGVVVVWGWGRVWCLWGGLFCGVLWCVVVVGGGGGGYGVCVGGCCCCGGAGRKGEAGIEPTHKKARVAATARYLP